MCGILVFYRVLMNLKEECRNKVLGNIFGIYNVSVSDISIREEEVIFRIFSEDVFYQFIFLLKGRNEGSYFKVSSGRDIVYSVILINDCKNEKDFIYQLVEIFRCHDEYQVYQLMRLFL